jgi:hypothetical protein
MISAMNSMIKPKAIYSKWINTVYFTNNLGKKMTAEIKLRMASFRESDIKLFDEKISKYSSKAV